MPTLFPVFQTFLECTLRYSVVLAQRFLFYVLSSRVWGREIHTVLEYGGGTMTVLF